MRRPNTNLPTSGPIEYFQHCAGAVRSEHTADSAYGKCHVFPWPRSEAATYIPWSNHVTKMRLTDDSMVANIITKGNRVLPRTVNLNDRRLVAANFLIRLRFWALTGANAL